MKSTKAFKETIESYLLDRALSDELFAQTYKKEGKNIDDCITYILNTVQKSGENGFTDDEIFSMAVHYYDEDKIEVGKPVSSANVVINHKVDLTEEEIKEAREQAKKRAEEDQYKKMTKKMKVVHSEPEKKIIQQSLF
jgi:hypothetical protein